MNRSTLTRTAAIILLGALACTSTPASAEPFFDGRRGVLGPPSFTRHLHSPRLVMRHQQAIGLDDDQRAAISGAVGETRGRLTELEWRREALAEAVGSLVEGSRVDEEATMAKASELMAVEQEIKREHLRLLIRIKNQLSAEQQATLRELGREFRDERRQRVRERFGDRRGPPRD